LTSFPVKIYTFAQWQTLGEDNGSIVADPMFSSPNYPADNYTLMAGSPAATIGFVPFDTSSAGLLYPLTNIPAVPQAFPLQLLNQSSGY
jgi:hypothetical protein